MNTVAGRIAPRKSPPAGGRVRLRRRTFVFLLLLPVLGGSALLMPLPFMTDCVRRVLSESIAALIAAASGSFPPVLTFATDTK